MLNEEKAKLKGKPRNSLLLLVCTLLLCIFSCVGVAVIYFNGIPYWDVSSFNGMDALEVRALLLEQLPIGINRGDVENYIHERMQASYQCQWLENNDTEICRLFGGHMLVCTTVMTVHFYFEENQLSDITARDSVGCL
jgi:hypothetical protein